LLSPALLAARSFGQLAGLLGGALYLLKNEMRTRDSLAFRSKI
jgi:hypothetical protein